MRLQMQTVTQLWNSIATSASKTAFMFNPFTLLTRCWQHWFGNAPRTHSPLHPLSLTEHIHQLLTSEQQSAQQKMANSWHWGNTGQYEADAIARVANVVLPLPEPLVLSDYFVFVQTKLTVLESAIRATDPDGYAIATVKSLKKAILTAISERAHVDRHFAFRLALALHHAIKTENHQAVTELVAAGADLTMRNDKGRTALDIARFCDDLASQVAILGNRALLAAPDASWAYALRHGIYPVTQLPPSRITDELCDEALQGSRHNYYSLPAQYVAVANLAKRCTKKPSLIANLPEQIAFNREFYTAVSCSHPEQYWPHWQADNDWIDYFLAKCAAIYPLLDDRAKTPARTRDYVATFAQRHGFAAVPAVQLTPALIDDYLAEHWNIEDIPQALLNQANIALAKQHYLEACRAVPGSPTAVTIDGAVVGHYHPTLPRLSTRNFELFATVNGLDREFARYAVLGDYNMLTLIPAELIEDQWIAEILAQRREWFGFELGFLSQFIDDSHFQQLLARQDIRVHRQPGEY